MTAPPSKVATEEDSATAATTAANADADAQDTHTEEDSTTATAAATTAATAAAAANDTHTEEDSATVCLLNYNGWRACKVGLVKCFHDHSVDWFVTVLVL